MKLGPVGERPGCGEGSRNEVDADDGEALLREIRGIDAFATADVERTSSGAPLRDRAFQECGPVGGPPRR